MKFLILSLSFLLSANGNAGATLCPPGYSDSSIRLEENKKLVTAKHSITKQKFLSVLRLFKKEGDNLKKKQQLARISFVLGLLALITAIPVAPLAVVLGTGGLVTGIKSLSIKGKSKKALAIIGVITSGLAIGLAVIVLIHFMTPRSK